MPLFQEDGMHKTESFEVPSPARCPVAGGVYEMPDGSLAVAGVAHVSPARGKALIPIRRDEAVHRCQDNVVALIPEHDMESSLPVNQADHVDV